MSTFVFGVIGLRAFGAQPTTVTLSATPNAATFGQPVTLYALVTAAAGAPLGSGKVTLYDGVTVLGTSPVANGWASLTTSLLASGVRSLRAYYAGDGTYAPSSSALSLTVHANPANTFVAGGPWRRLEPPKR